MIANSQCIAHVSQLAHELLIVLGRFHRGSSGPFRALVIIGAVATQMAIVRDASAQSSPPSAPGADANIKCTELSSNGAKAEAMHWCRRAAEAGYAYAQVWLAYQHFNGEGNRRDLVQAAIWARKAADQGDVHGQEMLATMYQGGLGVPQDYAQTMNWARKAAAQNSAMGQYTLGLLYGNGWGVAKDQKEAATWYQQAAEQGYDDAQLLLGTSYELGWGVPRDHAAALQWVSKAAEQGNSTAKKFLKMLQAQDNQAPEAASFAGVKLDCTAKNGDSAMLEVASNRTDVQWGPSHYHNGTTVTQTDDDSMAVLAGLAGRKYETVQYVRVSEAKIEFGDSEHWHVLDRYNGVLNQTYHKKFVFDPIRCVTRKKF